MCTFCNTKCNACMFVHSHNNMPSNDVGKRTGKSIWGATSTRFHVSVVANKRDIRKKMGDRETEKASMITWATFWKKLNTRVTYIQRKGTCKSRWLVIIFKTNAIRNFITAWLCPWVSVNSILPFSFSDYLTVLIIIIRKEAWN